MSAAHTPGPWKLEISDGPWVSDAYVMADKWGVVARLGLSYSLPHWDGPQRANARLIAAAPDLLEALEMVRDADNDCRRDGLPTIPTAARAKIDAAIAGASDGQRPLPPDPPKEPS